VFFRPAISGTYLAPLRGAGYFVSVSGGVAALNPRLLSSNLSGWRELSGALFQKRWKIHFGIRISGFFRISDFELRGLPPGHPLTGDLRGRHSGLQREMGSN
jgi:hypothetical protein